MINNSFDDYVKKRLGNYEPEVPPHIWEKINEGKEKSRPAGFLFNLAGKRIFMIAVLLILSAGGALLIHSITNNSNNKIQISKSGNTDKLTGSTNTDPSINQILEEGTAHSTDNKSGTTDQENNSTADPAPPAANHATYKIAEDKIAGNNPVVKNDKTNNKGLFNDRDELSSMKATHKNSKVAGLILSSSEITATGNKNEKITDESAGGSRIRARHTGSKTRMVIAGPDTDLAASTDENMLAANADHSMSKYFLNLDPTLKDKAFDFSVKSLHLSAFTIPCPGPEKNAAGNKRYIEIYGGPDYVFRTFSDTANSHYMQKRKESTSFSSAFSVGLRYTKVFQNSVSFRTGINYSQVNERFRFEQGHVVQLVYILDTHGDTIGSYATSGSRYKTTHNKYKTLDMPLLFGYEMGNGRLHTNINAGLVVNLYSWQKGDMLDNEYQPISITTGKTSSPYQFKTNVGIGFMGGASFYYKLNDYLHILAEPYFRYNFSPVNKAEITLKQKYTTVGLRLGLRIDF